jgi:RNA recognition motif-containing protein
MHQSFYEGRRTICQYASGNYQAADPKPTRPPSRNLFIGNLACDLKDRELNDIFKSVRNVIDVRVAIDRKSGTPRGFAHADFLDIPSAQVAAEILASKAPHGRRLRVDFSASSRRNQRGSNEDNRSRDE